MARYVDGFVLKVKKSRLKEYQKIAKMAGKVWKEHGALQYFECVGDDLNSPYCIPFPKLAKAKADEVVLYSFIVYESKAHRNRVNKAVMKDTRITSIDPATMPISAKQMSYGGFKAFVDL